VLGTFLQKTEFDVASPSTIESPARSMSKYAFTKRGIFRFPS